MKEKDTKIITLSLMMCIFISGLVFGEIFVWHLSANGNARKNEFSALLAEETFNDLRNANDAFNQLQDENDVLLRKIKQLDFSAQEEDE